ncbi:O-antigen ligase family protein [Coleofasciculus sp. FACHB-712]|uniref:O-antigen ligase family protein n=1 Tax=Coleofasciculus sp. FACHB-712 TaxID=2692789 RepID=UPI001686A31D|nr:O-antigen ligase family protein [Coleofasciculus sp. FACHB-712]MBD1943457.1 O-antigen ligase family protein [Coleofasciculus sp. FACHB-712]
MSTLASNPLLLIIAATSAIIYILLLFNFAGRSQATSKTLEKIFIGLIIFAIAGVTLTGFDKIHPRALYLHGKKLYSTIFQIGIYATFIFIIYSRFLQNIKNSVFVISRLLINNVYFCGLLFLLTLSAAWSGTPTYTLKASIVFLGTTAFCVYVGKQYKWKELFDLLLTINKIILLLSVFYALFRPSIGVTSKGWQGILPHGNAFGFLMGLTAVMCYIQSVRKPKTKWQSLGFAALSIFALQRSNSGMGKVLLVLLISVLIVIRFIKNLPPRLAFACIIFFMAIAMCLCIVITQNAEFIIVDTLNKDLTLTGRTDFWPLVINHIKQHPLLGYGYQGFWQSWRGAADPAADIIVVKTQFKPEHSHNGFLDLAVDLGFVGLGFFCLSFLTNIALAVQYMKRTQEPELVMPLLLITWAVMTNITETGLISITYAWLFYVIATVRLCLDATGKSSQENSSA